MHFTAGLAQNGVKTRGELQDLRSAVELTLRVDPRVEVVSFHFGRFDLLRRHGRASFRRLADLLRKWELTAP